MSRQEEFDKELVRVEASQDRDDPTRLDVIRECLRQKADPNLLQEDGRLPLQIAMGGGDVELCRLLLLYQADPQPQLSAANPITSTADTPEKCAAAELVLKWAAGEPDDVLELLETSAADAARCHDAHALGFALSALEVAGGDAEQCVQGREGGESLLHVCARAAGVSALRGGRGPNCARKTARALVGWGGVPDQPNANGETPLQLAFQSLPASSGLLEPAKALLEVEADPNQPARPGTDETLLMEAVREGDLAACELLLEFRADPLKRRQDGQTAITLASQPGAARQVLLTLRSALTREMADESCKEPAVPSRAGLVSQATPTPSRRRSGPFSKLAAVAPPTDTVAPARRRTSFETFSKLSKPSLDEKPLDRQSTEDLITPSSDQVKSMSFAESESETRPGDDTDEGPARATLFSMSDVDQEMCSAEGLLNQVDLEETYDDDWTVHFQPAWLPQYSPEDRDARESRGAEEAPGRQGYSNSWSEALPESAALQVAG